MDVEKLTAANQIEMYVSPACPYCRDAETFFRDKKIPFTKYDAQNDPALRRKMFAYSGGDPTVPAIVVDGEYVQSGWGTPPRG
jgi:glutaredoxin 3